MHEPVNHIIVGTAGHVDHGKTSLIQSLSGTDTDRLKEEKKRGITIELGFADLEAPDGTLIGIIDVPGHEKFIRNMLSGIGGIDIVLLVVAADEGVMPQTQEHLDIVRLLDIRKGLIAVTKADLVDEEWLELVHSDIRQAVEGTFLEQAALIDVSSRTGQGIEALRHALFDLAKEPSKRALDVSLLRMPIDRVFTIEGFGTVVTGTLIEGTVTDGQSLTVYPIEERAKVRNIQVHGNMVAQAFAGQRTAINLSGIKKEVLQRGQVLAADGSLNASHRVDVRLHVLPSSDRVVENASRLHLHVGSDEVLCKVVLLDSDALAAGESGYAQLRTEQPVALKRGDRFVVRYYSPVETVGGGVVLEASAPRHRRRDEQVLRALAIKESGDDVERFEWLVKEQSRFFPDIRSIGRSLGFSEEHTEAIRRAVLDRNLIAMVSEHSAVHCDWIGEARDAACALLSSYHAQQPLAPGMQREEFRNRLARLLAVEDVRQLDVLIRRFEDENRIQSTGATVRLKEFRIEYTQAQQEKREALLHDFKRWAHEPEDSETIYEGCASKEECRHILAALVSEGRLVRLSASVHMDAESFEGIRADIQRHIETHGRITLGELRDQLSTSRKFAMQILEYCDDIRMTRLEGDARVLL